MTDELFIQTRFQEQEVWNFDTYLCATVGDALVRLAEMAHGWPYRGKYASEDGYEMWRADLRKHGEALKTYSGPDGWDQIYAKYKDVAAQHEVTPGGWESQLGITHSKDFSPYHEEEAAIDKARLEGAREAFAFISEWLPSLWD